MRRALIAIALMTLGLPVAFSLFAFGVPLIARLPIPGGLAIGLAGVAGGAIGWGWCWMSQRLAVWGGIS